VTQGRLEIRFEYGSERYHDSTIQALADEYLRGLDRLITHCEQSDGGFTPSDFPLVSIEQVGLDRLISAFGGARAIADLYPVSSLQHGILFHHLYEPASTFYVVSERFRLRGALDARLFERAWQHVVQRHTILRTAFVALDEELPLQLVLRQARIPLEQLDWRDKTAAERDACFAELLDADRRRCFDLARPPLMRVTLIQIGPDEHLLLWSSHHLLFDGWSSAIVLNEMLSCYQAFARQQMPVLKPAWPYRDFIAWLQRQDMARAEAFWRQRLADFEAPTIAPLSHPSARAAADGMRAELSHRFALPLSAVEACARRCKVTANALVQAAWAILLARCSARDDVLFGVTVSGRPAQLHEIETRVGLFINTLPMRLCVPHERSVVSWLPEVQARQLELLDYQFTSLQSVQRWAGIAPGTSLFECELVFENFPHHAPAHGTAASDVGRLEVSAEGGITRPHYPLNLIVSIEGELRVRLIYDSERFDQTDVEQLVEHFEQLLNSIVSDPQQPIGKLSWLSPTRRRQLEGDWNRTARECAEGSIPALFTAQVKRAPAAIALSHRGTTLSYRELDERSNRLAHRLIDCGIGPETLIGVCMERSVEMVIAQLAILKAGAAYLPLDPADPVHRLACLLRDSGAALLLTRSSARADSPGPGAESLANSGWAGRLIDLDAQAKEIDAYPVTPSARNIDPHQLAYVMYTSGSTGAPKGVGVSHRNIARIIRGTDQLRVDERDVLLQLASATFDAATFEIWCTILNGAQLVLYPGERVDLAELEAVVRAERVSMLFLTAGLFNRVMDSQVAPLDTLRVLIAGGDVVSPVAARQRLERSPSCELINGYGPTEGTIFVTTYRVPNVRAIERTVPIGRPIANAQVYVLDANLDLVPPGIVGELYLGGLGLARGYHNRSGLTAERFIASPFLPGERLYRTGDLVRYLADGNLEFVARADRQVKIRGYRIEPAEIEAALLERPGVAQAVVLARTVSPPEKQLVAYVTGIANADLDVESLRAHLAARLPAYMQPSAVVRLAAMPLTAIGKIDRSALPVPGRDAFPHMPYEAPDGELEISLSRIWQDVLHVDSLSRHDNFFAIGGHSLSAMQVCARVRQMLERELPIRELFEHPTLRALAARIALTTAAAIAPIVRGSRERSLPLSDAQQRLWFLDRFEHAAGAYHVPCAVRLRGSLNRAALIRALDGIVARHEALRTVFAQENTEAVQIVCPPEPTVLTDIDLSLLSSEHRQQALEQTLTTELARAFDLGKGPLLRACLIRLHDTEHVLLITIHHISCDGWSLGVLLRELSVLYAAAVEDREASLPPMTIQYADYAIWQQQHLNEVVLKHPLQYWCEQLRDAPVLLELPADRPRPPMQSYRGGYARVRLEPPLTAALRELCRREAVTLFTVLLTGYAILLARLSAQSDLVIGVPIANRVKAEVEGLIGLFVNTLALRVRIDQSESSDSEGLTVRALLQSVSTQTIAAYTHQEVPFEQIVNALQPPRNLSHSPVFQVLFALQNAPKQPLSLPGLTTEPLGVADGKSKFDLSLSLQELGDRVEGTLNYATDLFDLERIERWVRHFECVLTAMTENVEAPVSAVPLLREAERARILREFSRVSDVRPYTQPVHRLFEEQVARAPAAIALVDGTREVTYAELNARANRLSKVLCERGVAAGDCVAVLMSRSVELVVAELAILKCGAAYVPIDPEFPRNRQAFIVQDCAARCGLTSGTVPAEQRAPLDWIDVDSLSRDSEYTFAANPTMTSDAEACAYVMYTSGSTGEPKGVRIAHRCIPRVVVDNGYATIEPDDCVAFCSNPAFDASTFEVWAALLNGARLVIVPQSKLLEPGSFAALLAEARVSVLFLSTGLFNQYAEQLASAFAKLRYLMFGGQAADPAIVRQLLRVGAPEHLLNGYGPTETTTFASSHTLDLLEEDTRSIPIGSPIAQTQIYILDAHRQPVPIGVRGELWIGGAGVTLGYLNRPELTQMRFVRDPFSADPAARMYRTGDFGCWRADGAIEYLGRNDTQVKIRGFRIELQEIEAQLTRHDQVREAVVLAHEGATYTLHGEGREAEPWADSERAGRAQPDGPNEKRLVAYVVPRDSSSGSAGPSVQSLRAHLSGILPEYMIPSVFVTLDHLPLTPNGKLDRQALPTPEQGAHATHEYERPQGEVEQTLAQIWQELLRVERVGRADHFFELGGHSLLAMKLIVRVAERLDTQLSVVAVFQRPTLRPLAQWIERRRPGNQEWLAPSSVNFEEGVI
jgi:amino acid adenylation domain-containing protein